VCQVLALLVTHLPFVLQVGLVANQDCGVVVVQPADKQSSPKGNMRRKLPGRTKGYLWVELSLLTGPSPSEFDSEFWLPAFNVSRRGESKAGCCLFLPSHTSAKVPWSVMLYMMMYPSPLRIHWPRRAWCRLSKKEERG